MMRYAMACFTALALIACEQPSGWSVPMLAHSCVYKNFSAAQGFTRIGHGAPSATIRVTLDEQDRAHLQLTQPTSSGELNAILGEVLRTCEQSLKTPHALPDEQHARLRGAGVEFTFMPSKIKLERPPAKADAGAPAPAKTTAADAKPEH